MDLEKLKLLELNKEYTWKEICNIIGFKYSTDGKTQKRQLEKLKQYVEVVDNGKTRKAKRYIVKNLFEQNLSTYEKYNSNNIYTISGQKMLEKNFLDSDYPLLNFIYTEDAEHKFSSEELEFNTMLKNIYDLKDGWSYTYNQMCKTLDIESKGGNAKLSQIKQIERLIDMVKKNDGKYFINQHYSTPLEKVDNKKDKISRDVFGNMALYGIMFKYFDVDDFGSEDFDVVGDTENKDIIVTRNELYKFMGMINGNYKKYKNDREALAKDTGTHIKLVNDYIPQTEKQLRAQLNKGLNNLKNRCIIAYHEDCTVLKYKGFKRLASYNEEILINEAEKLVLRDMGFKSKWQVTKNNKEKEFYKEVNDKLNQLASEDERYKSFKNLESSYKAIRIGASIKTLKFGYEEMLESVIESMCVVNNMMIELIKKHYTNNNYACANKLIETINKNPRKFGYFDYEDFFQELYKLNKKIIENSEFKYFHKKQAEKFVIPKDKI